MFEVRGIFPYADTAIDRPWTYANGSVWPWIAQDRSFRLLLEHDDAIPLASRAGGTLEPFEIDGVGLGFKAFIGLCHDQLARDIVKGWIGCSLGAPQVLSATGDLITCATVRELSLTEQPAFCSTSVWLADQEAAHPDLAHWQTAWQRGYRAKVRPRRTGNAFLDERNGYATTPAPKPQPSTPPPAARHEHGYVGGLLRAWNGTPMIIGHRDFSRRALGR